MIYLNIDMTTTIIVIIKVQSNSSLTKWNVSGYLCNHGSLNRERDLYMHLYIFGITFYGSGAENYSFLGVRGNFRRSEWSGMLIDDPLWWGEQC